MLKRSASLDELMNFMDITRKMETHLSDTLKEHELNVCMTALMSATITFALHHCKSYEEMIYYRNIFTKIFDSYIRSFKTKSND